MWLSEEIFSRAKLGYEDVADSPAAKPGSSDFGEHILRANVGFIRPGRPGYLPAGRPQMGLPGGFEAGSLCVALYPALMRERRAATRPSTPGMRSRSAVGSGAAAPPEETARNVGVLRLLLANWLATPPEVNFSIVLLPVFTAYRFPLPSNAKPYGLVRPVPEKSCRRRRG
jgi:hypothetical protein